VVSGPSEEGHRLLLVVGSHTHYSYYWTERQARQTGYFLCIWNIIFAGLYKQDHVFFKN
jgi:hypothetical protein